MSLLAQLPEDFLHHIWRTSNFELTNLKTLGGATIYIRKPGIWNHNQGPDFLDARLNIDGMEWHGPVELHVHSQDWYKHGHHRDKAYNNTILHVVLSSNGKQIFRQDGTAIPELVLEDRIKPELMHRYRQLQLEKAVIPCQAHKVDPQIIQAMLEQAALERIIQKASVMQEKLSQKIQDWEQILWEELLSMMGGPVNREVFRELAQRLPLSTLRKSQSDPLDMEALLFGAAGMLSGQGASYFFTLKERWAYQKEKYHLEIPFPLNIRYMRMRPPSFPGIRISQSAQLLKRFPLLTNLLSLEGFRSLMNGPIQASAYWDTHYRLAEKSQHKPRIKNLGTQQKSLLIINSLLPMALVYKSAHGQAPTKDFLIETMGSLPKEKNKITKAFETLSWLNPNSISSQGMIQLSKHYCQKRRCLHCEIGKEILA